MEGGVKEDSYNSGCVNGPAGTVHSLGAGALEEVQKWQEDQRGWEMLRTRYPRRDAKRTDVWALNAEGKLGLNKSLLLGSMPAIRMRRASAAGDSNGQPSLRRSSLSRKHRHIIGSPYPRSRRLQLVRFTSTRARVHLPVSVRSYCC